ncbi:MAG: HIT domain-containing protein [Chromatiales bacterium]|nr:HIT domain-containing protein [Chromatiales bacterium]
MFQLHSKLAADTLSVGKLQLCELRLLNDSRFPWAILVPMRTRITELHQLSAEEQTLLLDESNAVARCLAGLPTVEKINIAALGNIVPQFHWHVIGRSTADPCWPSPVWGCGEAVAYEAKQAEQLINLLRKDLQIAN